MLVIMADINTEIKYELYVRQVGDNRKEGWLYAQCKGDVNSAEQWFEEWSKRNKLKYNYKIVCKRVTKILIKQSDFR